MVEVKNENFTLRVLQPTASRADKLNPSKCFANKDADISGSESYSGNSGYGSESCSSGLMVVILLLWNSKVKDGFSTWVRELSSLLSSCLSSCFIFSGVVSSLTRFLRFR